MDRLIAQLGDPKYKARETAQKRLAEIGPLAFPALNKALNNSDPEIGLRAERILLNQNQNPNGGPQNLNAPARVRAVNGVLRLN